MVMVDEICVMRIRITLISRIPEGVIIEERPDLDEMSLDLAEVEVEMMMEMVYPMTLMPVPAYQKVVMEHKMVMVAQNFQE